MTEAAQRAGRAVRDPDLNGLFLTMVETWALELKLDGYGIKEGESPDKPYAGTLKKNSSKQDRTSMASLQFVQSDTCLRKSFAEYLGDHSPEGGFNLQ